MNKLNPCFGCIERLFGCHAGCEKYNAWKAEQDELKEKIHDARVKEQRVLEEPFRAVERSKK